jgi:putative FmdB family regulatory protein
MPIYEYVCTECDYAHEALQKLSDLALTDCPACAKSSLKKMISAPRFRLSGSGWYETDFKSSNQKNLTDSGDKKSTDSSDKKSATPEKTTSTVKKEPTVPKPATKEAAS